MKLIKFEKENCPYCDMVQNFLDAHDIKAEKINAFDKPEMAVKYDIGSVPVTILLDDDGNEIQRSVGFKIEELEGIISKIN